MSIHVQSGLFGTRIAAVVGLTEPPPNLVQAVGDDLFAVTRLTSLGSGPRRSVNLPQEQAYAIFVALPEGGIELRDLRAGSEVDLGGSFDLLQLYVPHAALVQHAARTGHQFDGLDRRRNGTTTDPQITGLARCLLPCLGEDSVAAGFVEGIALALYTHLIGAYGSKSDNAYATGGLAPWQQRKAQAMLAADLTAPASIAEVARGCRLSVSHFGRAFRRSTGTSPHQWLMQRRIGRAKTLLEQDNRSLADVALECGFADQSHFTRVFTLRTGMTPGRWRRACGGAPEQDSHSPPNRG